MGVLLANGGCCQWGLCCSLPCGPCSRVHFDLLDPNTKEAVGSITKRVPNGCTWLVSSETSNYEIDFQKVTDPKWKAIVLVLSIFIDFRYFSATQDPEDIGS